MNLVRLWDRLYSTIDPRVPFSNRPPVSIRIVVPTNMLARSIPGQILEDSTRSRVSNHLQVLFVLLIQRVLLVILWDETAEPFKIAWYMLQIQLILLHIDRSLLYLAGSVSPTPYIAKRGKELGIDILIEKSSIDTKPKGIG